MDKKDQKIDKEQIIEENLDGREEVEAKLEEFIDANRDEEMNRALKGTKSNDRVKELEKKLLRTEDQLKRAVADYRNLEKRVTEEKKELIKFANKELLLSLLPALDTLFLADKYTEDQGIKLTVKSVIESLKHVGVEKIDTENKRYDPQTMECVETVEGKEDMIIEEAKPGFTLYGKLLSPALVKVGKKKE